MIKIIKNRKAQIGTTLTWFPAMFLILFIFLLYFLGITLMVGSEKVKDLPLVPGESNFNNIKVGSSILQTKSQRELFGFLNSEVEFEGQTYEVKDLIFQSFENKDAKELLENELQSFAGSLDVECYIFVIGDDIEVKDLSKVGGIQNSRAFMASFLEDKAFEINLLKNSEEVVIQYYAGECDSK